ncbi:hypothetical protein EV121DRAFT_209614 [Schizophyllum commune]
MSRSWASDHKSEAACHINRLPPELLSLIFTISVDNSSHYLDSNFVPFTLTHVCTLWRNIAVDLATLWHRFDFKPCLGTGTHDHLATICAKRAKGLGLAISYMETSHLDFAEAEIAWEDNASDSAESCGCRLQLIGRLISQLRSLALVIGEPSAVQLGWSTREETAVALEDFVVLLLNNVSYPEALAPFYTSPALRRIRWSSIYQETKRLTFDIAYPMGVPREQPLNFDLLNPLSEVLADMAIAGFSGGQAAQFFKLCMHEIDESVVGPELVIAGEEPLDDVVLAPPMISLLRSLGLTPRRHFDEAHERALPSSESLLQSLRGVSEGLDSLILAQCHQIDELTLIKCIEFPQMAQLRHLYLRHMQLGVLCDEFICSLQADDSGHMISPKLEVLSLSSCTTSTDGIVAKMLESRRAFSSSLRIVHISFDETGQHDLDKRFIEEHFQTFWEE